MLPFIDMHVGPQPIDHQRGKPPDGAIFVFQFFAGDVVLLESMLPSSELVKGLEFGRGALIVSIRALAKFKNELERLEESALPEAKLPRSRMHPEFGSVTAAELRAALVEAVDEAVSAISRTVPL